MAKFIVEFRHMNISPGLRIFEEFKNDSRTKYAYLIVILNWSIKKLFGVVQKLIHEICLVSTLQNASTLQPFRTYIYFPKQEPFFLKKVPILTNKMSNGICAAF